MGALDTPGRGEFEDLMRRVRALETQSPLERSSVKNGRVRFIGGELRIDSGGQLVIKGTLAVDGDSTVTGTFTVSGPWNLTGTGTITGATSITGNVTVAGKLVQNGEWELNGAGKIRGNVAVEAGGKITVGGVVLDSSFGAPRVQLGSAQIDGGTAAFTFTVGTTVVYFIDNTIRIPAMPTKTAASTGLPAGVVHADGTGKLFRIV